MTRVRHKGFTLAEVLVASTISGFIAIVAVGAMNAISHTAQTVNRVSEVNSELRFAARLIAQDLANLYRDSNPENIKLLGVSQGSDTAGPPFLTFYTVGRAKARADQPEGDVYEVEYFLGSRQEQDQGPHRRRIAGRRADGALSPAVAQPGQGPPASRHSDADRRDHRDLLRPVL